MIITNSFIKRKSWFTPDVYRTEVFELHNGIEYDEARTVNAWLPRNNTLKNSIFFNLELECIDEINKRKQNG